MADARFQMSYSLLLVTVISILLLVGLSAVAVVGYQTAISSLEITLKSNILNTATQAGVLLEIEELDRATIRNRLMDLSSPNNQWAFHEVTEVTGAGSREESPMDSILKTGHAGDSWVGELGANTISVFVPVGAEPDMRGVLQYSQSTLEFHQSVLDMREKVFAVATSVFAVMMLFAVGLIRYMSRPIKTLLDATKALEEGDFRYQISEPRIDEFSEIYRNFNRMSRNIISSNQLSEKRERALHAENLDLAHSVRKVESALETKNNFFCLLYTSPSPRDS